jgi:hypothetical protein
MKKLEGGPVSTKTMTVPEWAKIGLLLFQAQWVAHDHQLQPGDAVYIQINKVNIAQQWAIKANKGKPMVQVPTEY